MPDSFGSGILRLTKKQHTFHILKTSLPAALDLASQPVMWLIEAVFIGRLSAAALGGVGFALQIILVTSTLLLTFVIGAIILINRHLGSNDRWGANHILGQTVMSGFLMAIPIGLVWYFGSPVLFKIIQEKEFLTTGSGIEYLQMIAFFAPVLVPNFIAIGMIRGAGDTHWSMAINVTMNVTNAVLTPILIYGLFGFPRMEVRGAALAMGIAHTLGFGITFFYLRRKTSTLFLSHYRGAAGMGRRSIDCHRLCGPDQHLCPGHPPGFSQDSRCSVDVLSGIRPCSHDLYGEKFGG